MIIITITIRKMIGRIIFIIISVTINITITIQICMFTIVVLVIITNDAKLLNHVRLAIIHNQHTNLDYHNNCIKITNDANTHRINNNFFKVQTYPSPRQSASQQTSPSPSTKNTTIFKITNNCPYHHTTTSLTQTHNTHCLNKKSLNCRKELPS